MFRVNQPAVEAMWCHEFLRFDMHTNQAKLDQTICTCIEVYWYALVKWCTMSSKTGGRRESRSSHILKAALSTPLQLTFCQGSLVSWTAWMVTMPGFGNLFRLTITWQLPPKKVSASPWSWMPLGNKPWQRTELGMIFNILQRSYLWMATLQPSESLKVVTKPYSVASTSSLSPSSLQDSPSTWMAYMEAS